MEKENYFIYNGDFSLVNGDYQWVPEIIGNLGNSFEDYKNGKFVLLNEEQTSFLKSHSGVTPEEVWNMTLNDFATVGDITALIKGIEDYDSSENVNIFYVNNVPVWFNKETRTALNNSISIEKEVGKDTTTLWINNTPYIISIDIAKQMLSDIELYTIACYNNTRQNIAEAQTITLKSEVANFDITKGYPEKLNFNL